MADKDQLTNARRELHALHDRLATDALSQDATRELLGRVLATLPAPATDDLPRGNLRDVDTPAADAPAVDNAAARKAGRPRKRRRTKRARKR